MKDIIDKFMAFHTASMNPASQKVYREALASVNRYFTSRGILMGNITTTDVAAWMDYEIRTRRRLGQTVRYKMNLLQRLFDFAIDQGLLQTNPVRPTQLPKVVVSKPKKVPFTYEEYRRLMEKVAESDFPQYWLGACAVAWHTGLRMSDVAGMRKDGLNRELATITVRPKKKAMSREELTIPIEPELAQILDSLAPHPDCLYVLAEFHWQYEGNRATLSKVFSQICKKFSFPDHTFHSFRHGFVTRLLNAGVEAITIASMTGQTVQQIQAYCHVSTSAKADALAKTRPQVIEI